MSGFYLIEPEVAGGLGENTKSSVQAGRLLVTKLHYQFDGWLGDELLESSPCFIVTERMATAIENESLTGATFDNVEVTASEQFMELYPDTVLPKFRWLKVDGESGKDDFAIAPDLRLVVSKRALETLRRIGIAHVASVAAAP